MSCHICASAHSRLPFLCSTCARNRLYQLRLENAQVLIEKEALEKQVEATVSHETPLLPPSAVKNHSTGTNHDSARSWAIRTILSAQAASLARKDTLAEHVETLKDEITALKTDISMRKALLARRRSDEESAQYQIGEREAAVLTGIQNTTKRTEHLWHSLHSKTAEARIFLCRESAYLFGLRQKTLKGDGRQTYLLGGTPVVDLRDMNSATPVQISTSLSNIARLLVLVSHYLSLRLPAEVTLPHRNYPTPTIYPPASSYHSHEAPERNDPSQLSAPSPAASRTADKRTQSRPRPLFIDKPLPRLAKEDPGAYALFLEGTALLAWDVAWLCRTQGIHLTSDSWEEVCNIGKSMWQLLVAPPAQTSTLMRAFAGRETHTKLKSTKDSPQTTIQRTKSFPMLGHYSHGTVHSFLAASEGSEFMRAWKLPTPTKIADKLKASLLGEMASAEWELLEENEWEDWTTESHERSNTHDSKVTTSPTPHSESKERTGAIQASPKEADEARRPKGTSGWTKLNSR
ncbi:hypothetical protein N7462_008759 [Penicillium macrosclerotiorum]|uniref:uncharacterized protein n=1 Tax=Penicillium macrosclerotiorum TaxID=303699 RepID=UPI0025499DD0|nr:uncharacterized protein N7462_008759 [Penicillium macrosclerotiorum]KAJ5675862.1 hypothetical protein N7462_008759 [Penicillium macrosclerotiorum]